MQVLVRYCRAYRWHHCQLSRLTPSCLSASRRTHSHPRQQEQDHRQQHSCTAQVQHAVALGASRNVQAVLQAPQSPQPPPQPGQPYIAQPEPAGTFHVSLIDAKAAKGKIRLDSYLSSQLTTISRAKISASIKAGLILVNGAAVSKPAAGVKAGDVIAVSLLPPEPCTAIPETIPLDVVFEDAHLIVVNKAPGMVVHLSPGHSTGTLVNALLAHCGLPPCEVACGSSSTGSGGLMSHAAAAAGSSAGVMGGMLEDDLDEAEDDESEPDLTSNTADNTQNNSVTVHTNSVSSIPGILRPGIVHRLDRGTSGLMVVAKTDYTHAHLCSQFKERSVSRIYNSITTGVPNPLSARVATNITRDPGNRLRMIAAPYGTGRGRTAASNYRCLEVIRDGGAAVVEWKLESGRTHQIRVHSKHIGNPLLGDDLYGPGHAAAAKAVTSKRSSLLASTRAAIDRFGRPALHAKTLGFTHPVTGERLQFDSHWPEDFVQLYDLLKGLD